MKKLLFTLLAIVSLNVSEQHIMKLQTQHLMVCSLMQVNTVLIPPPDWTGYPLKMMAQHTHLGIQLMIWQVGTMIKGG